MSMRFTMTMACAALLAVTGPVSAQPAGGAAPADAGAPPAGTKAKAAARTPRPAQAVTITNASGQTATEVVVTSEDEKTTKLAKPLAPKGRATLKMLKLKGCLVQVAATFEGEGRVDVGEFDICKDKTIRFTD